MKNKMIRTETDPLGNKEYVVDVATRDKMNVIKAICNADKIKISVDRKGENTEQITDEYTENITKVNLDLDSMTYILQLSSGRIIDFDFESVMYRMDDEQTYVSWSADGDYAPEWCPDGSPLVGFTLEKIC